MLFNTLNHFVFLPSHSSQPLRHLLLKNFMFITGLTMCCLLYTSERLDRSMVCECEAVTAGEVRYAVDELNVNNLVEMCIRDSQKIGLKMARG